MTSVATLIRWLSGDGMLRGPLCGCGAAAELTDDGAELCWACVYRRADLAARPGEFETQVLAGADTEHGDVVRLRPIDIVVDEHMHVAWPGIVRHRTVRRILAWQWSADWPTDDRTLEDLLEIGHLERLWAAGRAV